MRRPAQRAKPRKNAKIRSAVIEAPVAGTTAVPAPVPVAAPAVAPAAASFRAASASARRLPWRSLGAFFVFAFLMAAVGGFIISAVHAATFQPPTQAPPGGNVPITVWNRIAGTVTQPNTAVAIDGGTLTVGIPDIFYGNMAGASPAASNGIRLQTDAADRFKVTRDGNMTATGMSAFGTAALALGAAQNLIYGNVDTTSTGSLLLFQNESLDRFRVDVQGRISTGSADAVMTAGQNLIYGNIDTTSTGSLMLLQTESVDKFRVNARGDVKAAGCFGKTFVGLTASVWPGNIGSYYAADNKCGIDWPGSHVCRTEEIIESIECSVLGDPIRTNGGNVAWFNGGPPGDPARNANDCIGWTSNASTAYGRVWIFDNTTGGRGTLTGCNVGGGGLKYACCR